MPIFKLIPSQSFSSCPARSQACADCVNLSALPGIHVFFSYFGKTWMAPELGLPEFRIIEVPQVG
jgi:hypothetical protein